MVVIICGKYRKNPSRTVNSTEQTRFSRPRPNDLEDISQGQMSLYATHPLILVIICAKYGQNPSRIVGFFLEGQGWKFFKIFQKFKFPDFDKNVTHHTPSNKSDHLCQISKESIQNCRRHRADTIYWVKAKWPWRYRSRSRVITWHTLSCFWSFVPNMERINPEL